MGIPSEETIRLVLQTFGIESVKEAIEGLRALKEQTGQLSGEQEQALINLETYRNIIQDVGKGEQVYMDLLVEEAQDRRIANEMIREGVAAAEAMRVKEEELAEVTRRNAEALRELAGAEGGVSGFSGLASSLFKAERVAQAVATGGGLARIGGMLESITTSLGMAGGVGMAAGGLLYALEGIIPKLTDFFAKFEAGASQMEKVRDAMAAIDRGAARGGSRRKRALQRTEAKIAALEDKEDEQGFLALDDQADLRTLREKASQMRLDIEREENDVKASDEELKRRERVAEAQAELDFEENDPDAQFQRRRRAARARRAAANETFSEGMASADQVLRQIAADDREKEATDREIQRNSAAAVRLGEQADRERAQAQRDADREAARAARAAAPLAQLRAAQAADEDRVGAVVMDQWNRGGRVESPELVRATVRNAAAALPDYSGDIVMAVNAGYDRAMMQFRAAQMRLRQQSFSRLDD